MNFEFYNANFKICPEEDFELLIRKGIFPYEYIALTSCRTPSRESSFYSSLTLYPKTITRTLWTYDNSSQFQQFFCSNFGRIQRSILKTDVLLLVDIFENFRNKCIESYGLGSAY